MAWKANTNWPIVWQWGKSLCGWDSWGGRCREKHQARKSDGMASDGMSFALSDFHDWGQWPAAQLRSHPLKSEKSNPFHLSF